MSEPERPDDIRAMFDPSPYIQSWELNGKDVTVTVARVTGEEVTGEDGKKSHKPIIHFSDWPKPLCPGKRVVGQLIMMLGVVRPKDFVGKRFTLYGTREQKVGAPKGEMHDVVRVRKQLPPPLTQQRAVKPIAERVATFVSMLKTKATEAEVEELWKSAPADKLRADVDPATLDTMTLEYEARLSEVKENPL